MIYFTNTQTNQPTHTSRQIHMAQYSGYKLVFKKRPPEGDTVCVYVPPEHQKHIGHFYFYLRTKPSANISVTPHLVLYFFKYLKHKNSCSIRALLTENWSCKIIFPAGCLNKQKIVLVKWDVLNEETLVAFKSLEYAALNHKLEFCL